MASSQGAPVGSHGNNDQIVQLLTDRFAGQLDVEIIESVLDECNYDFEVSSRNLADMLGITSEANPPQNSTQNTQTTTESDLYLPLEEFAKKGYKTLIILRGLPGSGKSYLAKELLHEIIGPCNPRDFIFSADDYFMQNGVYKYNSFQVKDAHDWTQKRVYTAIGRGISPIFIDNTNTQSWEMKPYVIWAVQNGYKIYIREPNTSWKFKLGELARRNKHKVPKDKIMDMLDRFNQFITVEGLMQEFGLFYGQLQPPIIRNLPPVRRETVETSARANCLSSALGRMAVVKKDATTTTATSTNNTNSDREITSTGNFINNGQLPPVYPREGCFDKGSSTDDENDVMQELSAHEIKEQAIDILQGMFESIPRDALEEVLFKCKGDVEWCINILLEDPKELLENYQPPKKAAKIVITPIEAEKPEIEELQDEAAGITKKLMFEEAKNTIESGITINPEHYGPNVSKLKGLTLTTPVTPNPGPGPSRQIEDDFVMLDSDYYDDQSTISEDSEAHSSEGQQDDDMVELNLGPVLVDQLNQLFGDPEFPLPGFYSPVIEISRKQAKQLHALYYESVLKQMEVQQVMLLQMQQEDEEMQMKLQMEEIRKMEEHNPPSLKQIMKDQAEEQRNQKVAESQWRNLTPIDMAYKLTMQKLAASFPKVSADFLEEIYRGCEGNYEETVSALQDSGAEYVENLKKTLSAGTLQEMQVAHDASKDAQARDQEGFDDRELTSVQLRQEAANHQKQRVDLLNKAKSYYNKGMSEVATFYSDLASQQTRMWEKYNSMAAVQIVNEGFHRSDKADTIDLHFLRVTEALIALDIYIDEVIDRLQSSKKNHKDIFVITGRGKNSPRGIPRIRPGVEQRLKKRNLKYTRVNDGLLKVKVNKNALVTAQLMVQS
ncbi:NEDD4-binding protein 2 [Atheta coriaria]|uniref:NEDD4-binding protein 2 n=1 Tax=Dalotia coriaria TaxID=877792 RepID=UPI0031F34F07